MNERRRKKNEFFKKKIVKKHMAMYKRNKKLKLNGGKVETHFTVI